MQKSQEHQPEEIEKRREFSYRAYSPDSEPPEPEKEPTPNAESVKQDSELGQTKPGRQSA